MQVQLCCVIVGRRWVCSVCRARAPCAVAGTISGRMVCGGPQSISSVTRSKRRRPGQRTCKALQTHGRGRILPQHALCGKSGKEPRNDKYMGHHFRDCIRGILIGVRARVCTGVLEQKKLPRRYGKHMATNSHSVLQHGKHVATVLHMQLCLPRSAAVFYVMVRWIDRSNANWFCKS